ncbi:TetR/AcrR family transcriptional regulator [Streptomyces sp. NPDC050560]|uniref:TetR/AcrR family transcriptional regulator n=1 Tax=Streptomyces sp. NPDC050560 TaxID=3365630 RepID=UPI0037B3658E
MTTGVRRRMGVEERRRQLIGVALELFSQRSPDDVSIDEIAASAGISRPLVYHYFPGKLSLYEAALRRAAEDLAERFTEPRQGPLGARLLRVMGRFFDFVEEHGPGFSALMRGGPAAGSSAASALVEGVREAAKVQILSHLDAQDPPPRLELVVRSWVSLAESTALIWLEDRAVPRAELELKLVGDFAALVAVAAAQDPGMAGVLGRLLAEEHGTGPLHTLLGSLSAFTAPRDTEGGADGVDRTGGEAAVGGVSARGGVDAEDATAEGASL